MPLELPVGWILTLNVAGWLFIQLGLAWGITRLPDRWFEPPGLMRWEAGGRAYERWLGIKRWKAPLPDGANWFEGGFAKAKLASRQPAYLRRFLRETWRGEICHWLAIACAPTFFLWNPWWGDLVIVAYAITANLPCILVQRYNRARLTRLLRARAKDGT